MWSTALSHCSRVWILQTAAQPLRYLPKLHVRLSPHPVDDDGFLTSRKRRPSRRRPMFHLNPSSFSRRRSITTVGKFATPDLEAESFVQRSATVHRLRGSESGSPWERELDWAGWIRQKLIYVIIQSTEYSTHRVRRCTIHYLSAV